MAEYSILEPGTDCSEGELAVNSCDSAGAHYLVVSDNLEGLSAGLAAIGYEGARLRVEDSHGFTRGWVSATVWRYT